MIVSSGTRCNTWPQQRERADFSNKNIYEQQCFALWLHLWKWCCLLLATGQILMHAFKWQSDLSLEEKKTKTTTTWWGNYINLTHTVPDQRTPNDWVSRLESMSWSDLGRIYPDCIICIFENKLPSRSRDVNLTVCFRNSKYKLQLRLSTLKPRN